MIKAALVSGAVLLSGVICLPQAHAAAAPQQTQSSARYMALEDWVPWKDDTFFVDTQDNMGYLAHVNGQYTAFRVVSGQQAVVHYMRRTYDAATPDDFWVAKMRQTQSDRVTFGADGTFYRLFANGGKTYTSYGIHGHLYADKMLKEANRYKSMGCIIVADDILEIVGKTFDLNGGSLRVVTGHGMDVLPPISPEL